MSSNYYNPIALDIINSLPDEEPFHTVDNFFGDCIEGFDTPGMIKHFNKLGSSIFNPDSKRSVYTLSADELHKEKYKMFTKMHSKVIALTEEINKKLVVSLPNIVVNRPTERTQRS
jgi:hypothetical protein